MHRSFIQLILLSVRRRKRSMWKVAAISFLCVFLFAGIMIFQDCMNRFQREIAFSKSGEWVMSTEKKVDCITEHAWIDKCGWLLIRTGLFFRQEDVPNSHQWMGYAGCMNEEFFELSHLKLYSGKLPENKDEIVITQRVLSKMGYSYELGQTITLYYTDGTVQPQGELNYTEVKYVLSGIMENYTDDWEDSVLLAEFFMAEEGLDKITYTREDTTRYYYHADRRNRNLDGEAFFKRMCNLLEKEEGYQVRNTAVYNAKAYDVTMWGDKKIYHIIMMLCALVGSMSLTYLFLVCCNARRPYYFKLREIGAGPGQIRGMVCVEWSAVFFPSAFSAMLTAAILSVIVAAAISKYFGIGFILSLRWISVVEILGFTLGTFILVMFWCCLCFQVKNLHEMTGNIPLKRLKHLVKKYDKHNKPVALFFKRQKRAEPGKYKARIVFTVVTMSIFFYSMLVIQDAYRNYLTSEARVDIQAEIEGSTPQVSSYYANFNGGLANYEIIKDIKNIKEYTKSFQKGFPKEDVQELKNLFGIDKMEMRMCDEQLSLNWEGQKNNNFRQNWYIFNYLDNGIKSMVGNLGITEENKGEEKAWEEYNKVYSYIRPELSLYNDVIFGVSESEAMDALLQEEFRDVYRQEDFHAGKQSVLLIVAPQLEKWFDLLYGDEEDWEDLYGKVVYDDKEKLYRFQCQSQEIYQYDFSDDTIQDGESLWIENEDGTKLGDNEVIVCRNQEACIRILSEVIIDEMDEWDLQDGLMQGYFLITSEEFVKNIAKREGEDYNYSGIKIRLKEEADKKDTEYAVAEILSRTSCSFINNIQDKNAVRMDFYRQITMFGIVLLLTGLVYLFIFRNMRKKMIELSKERLQIFLQSGCDRQKICLEYAKECGKEILYGLLSIPLVYGILHIGKWNMEGGLWIPGAVLLIFLFLVFLFTALGQWKDIKEIAFWERNCD